MRTRARSASDFAAIAVRRVGGNASIRAAFAMVHDEHCTHPKPLPVVWLQESREGDQRGDAGRWLLARLRALAGEASARAILVALARRQAARIDAGEPLQPRLSCAAREALTDLCPDRSAGLNGAYRSSRSQERLDADGPRARTARNPSIRAARKGNPVRGRASSETLSAVPPRRAGACGGTASLTSALHWLRSTALLSSQDRRRWRCPFLSYRHWSPTTHLQPSLRCRVRSPRLG